MPARITAVLSLAGLAATALGAVNWSPAPAMFTQATDPMPPQAGRLSLVTERVIVFKDGYGLFVKSASGVADAEGRVHTEQVPGAAVLGTFWAMSDQRPIKSTIAEWHESVRAKTEEGPCLTTLDVLRANLGKQVKLGIGDKELAGKVLEVLEAPAERAPLAQRDDGTYAIDLAPRGGQLVALEVPDKGRLVMPVSHISTVSGKDLATQCRRSGEIATRNKRLTFDFGKDTAGKAVTVRLFYFTPGVRWIPTYRVGTSAGTGNKADLELQAEILNEEEDFVNAAVDLVVGVPTFKFKSTVSPMSLEATLRSTLSQAMPGLMGQHMQMSNAMFNSRSGERMNSEEAEESRSVMGMAAELGAETKQDLFVYPVKSLGLRKGTRAMVSLWHYQVPQRHLYSVEFGTYTRTASDGAPLKLAENKVWHQLELTNETDVPWTTGAAMLMQGAFPLGQDMLGYTSPGGRTMVPMTVALNLRANHSERDLERTANSLQVDGRWYSLVHKKGVMALANHQKERATFRVTLSSAGKVSNPTHTGKVAVDAHDRVNDQSTVSWEVTLDAGQSLTLGYDLSVYL